MFSYIKNAIWGKEPPNLALDEAYKILEQHDTEVMEEEPEREGEQDMENYQSQQHVGVITNIKNCKYEIDHKYHFESEHQFSIGMKVSFTIYKDIDACRVTDVQEIIDEWVEEESKTTKWCLRNIIGEIVRRSGHDFYVDPGNEIIHVNLNKTAVEFIPIIGDFVEMETKCEIDENVINLRGKILEIMKISPVRPKMIEGIVKSYNNESLTGTVNKDIFFNKEALISGYYPKVGDKVAAEIIESNQPPCYWRCLKLIPHTSMKSGANAFGNLPKLQTYQHEGDGITISDNVNIRSRKFNEPQTFNIQVTNDRNAALTLKSITFEGLLRQLKLQAPTCVRNFVIEPKAKAKFTFVAAPKSIGKSKEIILFNFQDVTVSRIVYILLQVNNHRPASHAAPNNPDDHYKLMHNLRMNKPKTFIRGEPAKQRARFQYRQLNEWRIPENFAKLYYKYDNAEDFKTNIFNDLTNAKQCLTETLTLKNYADRFQSLLYMEELSNLIAIRRYDKDRACFIAAPGALILEVENLAENRPSIIVGDRIIASSLTSSVDYEGVVHKVSGSHLHLKFSTIFHQHYNGEDYKVHVVPSRSIYRKSHEAIYRTKLKMKDILFPNHIVKKTPQTNFTYEPYEDDMTFLNAETTTVENKNANNGAVVPATKPKSRQELIKLIRNLNTESQETSITKSKSQISTPFKLEWFNRSLNYYQKEAVRNILLGEARPLPYIIFGPPGTGKTVTVIECILQIIRLIPHSRLLISAPSNSSANVITTRLIRSGCLKPGDLVRLVSFRSITENMVPAEIIPYCALASIGREGTTPEENFITDGGYIKDMTMTKIGRHRVTIGTCGSLGILQHFTFPKGHFTHVVVDEAGQCTEPEIMIPLTNVDATDGQIILAGDPMQLGPAVFSREAIKFGFEDTYLDRLINRFPYVRDAVGFPKTAGYNPCLVTKLLYNYRSLPSLLHISNSCFYFNELRAILSDTEGEGIDFINKLSCILPKTKDGNVASLIFHGVNGINRRGEDYPSWYNSDEASQVLFYVNELYRLGIDKDDIGIITPYTKQVRQIRQILREAAFDYPKVGTVEEFQGSEYKIVLISTVRSNAGLAECDKVFSLGFTANPRRFNVALTRSKFLTIIIGNPSLLSRDNYWGIVLKTCVDNKSYIGCDY